MASTTLSPSCSSSSSSSSSSLSTCLSLTPERQYEENESNSSNRQNITATPSNAAIPRSQSIHKQIQAPRYVRSIPIGLQRANTLSSPVKQQQPSTATAPDNAFSPVTRRTSGPYPEGDARPTLPPRSESAIGLYGTASSPSKLQFSRSYNGAPEKKLQSLLLYEYGDTSELSELPSDPKTWTPSQLSIYLSHMLRLTPRPVIADVMQFVVQRGLTGKRFLRLRNQDLVEMGININWCRVLSTARERLRRECLRGRIFGFTVQDTNASITPSAQEAEEGEETIESLFLRLPTSASATSLNPEWNKNSWRRTEGKKSRGRVKGIAKVFEDGTNDTPDELGRRRSLSSMREAELDEVSRIRRNRQESTDSELSNVSSTGASYNSTLNSPKILLPDTPSGTSRFEFTKDNIAEISGSDSETEDQSTSSTSNVNWASVEPLAIEETASLPENFFADLTVPSSSSSSPSTPCAATFNLSSTRKTMPDNIQDQQETNNPPNRVENSYQSYILSHGQEAYAAIRARKQSDLSEVTDELSEEHLAYWNHLPAEELPSQSAAVDNSSCSIPVNNGMPALSDETSHEREETALESAEMVFAESDGNVITMKKHHQPEGQCGYNAKSLSKRTRSVEDFGSLKFHTVQSHRTSVGGSTRTLLQNLFDENDMQGDAKKDATGLKNISGRRKDSKRLSDLFRDDDKSDQYYSLKSRSGSIMILPRAEVEEMQARLKDLEQQLELAKSTTASRASYHSKSSSAVSDALPDLQLDERRRESRSQAMSDWVKGALCEANTVVSGGAQEPSWLGLGSWALAAGLGIGIVVGEAVFNKMRR